MNKTEAIKVLKKDLQIIDDPNVTMTASEWEEHDDHMRDALDMAIEALEQEPTAQSFSEEQIQTMQELESAQVEKAYELGKADRPTGHWIVKKRRIV